MAEARWLCVMAAVMILIPVHGCTEGSGGKAAVFEKQAEVMEIRPQKPVKIKLKRNASGQYSWDLSGDDADRVLEAEKKLREGLEK